MGTLERGVPVVDWEAVERLPEFQELTAGRQRFAWRAGGLGIGLGALYVVLAAVARGLMGTKLIGSFSLGFAGGVALIVVTWIITLAYMRRSDRVWGPLEERIRERVADDARRPDGEGRFTSPAARVTGAEEAPR